MALPITIDGAQGEGGGQILRTSLALAAVLGQPVRIVNIRAGRPKPGLAAQHLTACRAVAAVCNGLLVGDELRSMEIRLEPGPLRGGEFIFDVADIIASAGATTLILQAILPALLFAPQPSHIVLRGGTDVPFSPVFTYVAAIFAPLIREMGGVVRLQRNRAGWYPAGGGEIEAWIEPLQAPLQALRLEERGAGPMLKCYSIVSERLPRHIAERQNRAAAECLREWGRAELVVEQPPSGGPGTTCVCVVGFERGRGGYSALGERGKPAEKVGAEAGEQARQFLMTRATVDERLADQLLLYLALAAGDSCYLTPRITEHLRTNATVIAALTGVQARFSEGPDKATRVEISGLGLAPRREGGK